MPAAKITFPPVLEELTKREREMLEEANHRISGYEAGGMLTSYLQDFTGESFDAYALARLLGEVSQLRKSLREEQLKSTVWRM